MRVFEAGRMSRSKQESAQKPAVSSTSVFCFALNKQSNSPYEIPPLKHHLLLGGERLQSLSVSLLLSRSSLLPSYSLRSTGSLSLLLSSSCSLPLLSLGRSYASLLSLASNSALVSRSLPSPLPPSAPRLPSRSSSLLLRLCECECRCSFSFPFPFSFSSLFVARSARRCSFSALCVAFAASLAACSRIAALRSTGPAGAMGTRTVGANPL